MSLDLEQDKNIWKTISGEELYNNENALISEDVYNELKTGNYHILITDAFKDVKAGQEKSVKLHATRYLATSHSIIEDNKVEIIEVSGIRPIEGSVPGDYVPTAETSGKDEDGIELIIIPPTGTMVNYILYAIAGIATFAILVVGIVIIKKKIIK